MNKNLLLLSFLTCALTLSAEGKAIKLQESVITTENFETTVRDTPSNVSIVTGEEIEKSGAKDLVGILKEIPGLFVKEYAGGEIRFDLRGQNPMYANKNIIVTIDGVPINRVGLGSTDSYNLSQIPMDRIERIEVIPSGGSVLYGDGSVSGVINILTKGTKDKSNYGSINLLAGSNDLFSETFTYGTKIGDKFLTEFSLSKYNSKGDGRHSKNEEEKIDKFTLNYGAKYLLDDGDIEFKYNHGKSNLKKGSTISDEVFNENSNYTGSFRRSKYELNDFYLKYRKQISNKIESLTYINYLHNDYTPYSGGEWETNRYKERKKYVKTQLKYSYLEDSYAIFGGDVSNQEEKDSDPGLKFVKDGRKAQKESYSLFLMNKYNIGKWQFSQGIRREYTDYDFYYQKLAGVNPTDMWYRMDKKKFKNTGIELSANYLYSETGSSYLTLTRGYRTPSAIEMGSYEGDKKSQINDTVEAGIKDFIGSTFLSGSIFYTRADNYMYSKIPNNLEDWEKSITENIGKVDKYGLELSSIYYLDKLTLKGGLSYLHHEIKEGKAKGKKIPSVPNWKLTAGATYNFTDNFAINLDALYHGSYTVLDALKYLDESKLPSSGNGSSLEKYKEKVNSYITVDLSTNYTLNNGLILTARIDNIFDEQYDRYTGAWEDYSGNPKYIVQQHLPAPGRTFTVGATYTF